ncbi:unnamed protein product, partial [Ilex paraguariensis]
MGRLFTFQPPCRFSIYFLPQNLSLSLSLIFYLRTLCLVTKFNAMISGLFQTWNVRMNGVSQEIGRSSEGDLVSLAEKEPIMHETASARSLLSAQGIHFYFLLFREYRSCFVGLDLIGEQ